MCRERGGVDENKKITKAIHIIIFRAPSQPNLCAMDIKRGACGMGAYM